MKQFLLTLLATTISIVLTFGTYAVIEKRKKEAAKKEMVMMIIYDFDKTIEQVKQIDSMFHAANMAQQELAQHPEYFDSIRWKLDFLSLYNLTDGITFNETIESIFSSNIETFNTIGNADFVHQVSTFYNMRHLFKNKEIGEEYRKNILKSGSIFTIDGFFNIEFSAYNYVASMYLAFMLRTRDHCMKMMGINEDDMDNFAMLHSVDEKEKEELKKQQLQMINEMFQSQVLTDRFCHPESVGSSGYLPSLPNEINAVKIFL